MQFFIGNIFMTNQICFFCRENAAIQKGVLNYLACPECINSALKLYQNNHNEKHKNINNNNNDELTEYIIGFGKNKGKRILEVEPNYIKWCLENFDGLRDVEVFQNAFERLTGERVSTPAALSFRPKVTPQKNFSKERDTAEDFPF